MKPGSEGDASINGMIRTMKADEINAPSLSLRKILAGALR